MGVVLQDGLQFHVTVGKEYLVLGVETFVRSSMWGNSTAIQYMSDYEELAFAPLLLFEIVDGRVSGHWEMRMGENGSITLWPPSFYKEFYHDHLSDGVPDVVKDFGEVYSLLSSEYE
jgi:hypothetical protein